MKKKIAVLFGVLSLVVMFLTGCNGNKEVVIGENVDVSIVYEKNNEYNGYTLFFNGEKMTTDETKETTRLDSGVTVSTPIYVNGFAPTIKVDKLVQGDGYFKVIIEGKEFTFSNNYYSYRIL